MRAMGSARRGTTPQAWVRWIIAAGCAVLGLASVTATTANVVARIDLTRARALARGNGTIAAAAALQQFGLNPSAEPNSQAAQTARAAILDDPTAVKALVVLAFQASLSGSRARSDAIFAQASRLTRRELRSQIWAIENAVNQGDVLGALRHYDVALRTSTEAPAMLFPTLASALAEPRIRASLIDVLSAHPSWQESFVAFLADSPVAPRSAAVFFQEAAAQGIAPDNALKAQLVDQLFEAGAIDESFAYYATFRPVPSRLRSRDERFNMLAERRAVFDWTTGQDAGLSAGIFPDKAGGLVDFALSPRTGAIIVQQIQVLAPGTYVLSGRMSGIDQPAGSRPYWTLMCENARELGRINVSNSAEQERFSGRFTVPQGCKVQTLALIARPSEVAGGVVGQVKSAELAPARN